MNRRQFLQRLGIGVGVCTATFVAVPLLAKLPFPVPHKVTPKKFYPWYTKEGELVPLHPDNIQIRADSEELVASFTTEAEYAALFARAGLLHRNLNDAEAGHLARIASRKLPKRMMPPKEVMQLSCMLTAYGVKYNEGNQKGLTPYDLPCRKHTTSR